MGDGSDDNAPAVCGYCREQRGQHQHPDAHVSARECLGSQFGWRRPHLDFDALVRILHDIFGVTRWANMAQPSVAQGVVDSLRWAFWAAREKTDQFLGSARRSEIHLREHGRTSTMSIV